MNRSERAAQIWPLLVHCALHRQSVTYDHVGKLIGVPRQGLGQLLEPIQSHCILKELPALTSLVIGRATGMPGEGFIAAADVPAEQALVFSWKWLDAAPPGAAELEDAATKLSSNGTSLLELKAKARQLRG
jgi:hypothetical protein